MKKLFKNPEAKKALYLGILCFVSYLAVYIVRNTLGAVTPQMVEDGSFTTEAIGAFSSGFFMTYAIGQLINGIVGDRIKAKYMLGLGLIFAGAANLVFTVFYKFDVVTTVSYFALGFFLSMIYAPMTRLVAENTELVYATRCSVGYSFAALLGSPAAGLFAIFLTWKGVFNVGSTLLIAMGIICLVLLTAFEKKGYVKQKSHEKKEKSHGDVRVLFKRQIVKFTLISILTGVIRTTVVFWMPTYFSDKLGLSPQYSAAVFTVATLAISFTSIITVAIYEKLKHNMDLTVLLCFIASSVFFILLFFINQPILNVICMVLAIMSANGAASMLWSRYCPSLADTGLVSSATGFLDFVSYMAASISSKLFVGAVDSIGWSGLILVWFALMVLGTVISLPFSRKKAEEIK